MATYQIPEDISIDQLVLIGMLLKALLNVGPEVFFGSDRQLTRQERSALVRHIGIAQALYPEGQMHV